MSDCSREEGLATDQVVEPAFSEHPHAEAGAPLGPESEGVGKLLVEGGGVACDRVVDTQVPQSSIYVYGKKKTLFTDTDTELYGYSHKEINTIRAAFALAKSKEARIAAKANHKHIETVVRAAKKSLETLENVKVGE